MAPENTLRADPQAMQGFAQGLCDGAEALRNELAELDDRVGGMLGGWRGASGDAYTAAWQLWQRGAGEVQAGLSMLAQSIAEAGGIYARNEATSAAALRVVDHG